MENTLKTVTIELLKIVEFNQVLQEKRNFVKNQEYDKASDARKIELELKKDLMGSTELLKLKEKLLKL